MIQLKACRTNPNHWYSDHSSLCPWCRMLNDSNRDIFPHPNKTLGFVQNTGSQQQSVFPDQNQEISLPHVSSPSVFGKIPTIAWIGIIGLIIVLLIMYTNASATSSGGTHLPVTPPPNQAITFRITELPTTIPQTSSAGLQDPQNGMRLYTNQQDKYTIDYPASWNVKKDGSTVSFSPFQDPVFTISSAQNSGSLQDFFLSQSLKIQTNPDAGITNHDFKTTLGYRIDYVIRQKGTSKTTKVTEIYTEGHTKSQIFIISYRGTDINYNEYSGHFNDMVRSFRLL